MVPVTNNYWVGVMNQQYDGRESSMSNESPPLDLLRMAKEKADAISRKEEKKIALEKACMEESKIRAENL